MTYPLMIEGRERRAPPAPADGTVDPAAIRQQLQRLLEHPSFKSSKRCRHFLEHVIEHALTPVTGAESLKERTLGVQVFGREPSYDTAADPVVRVTAGDIRRRLGQYYAEPAHQRELRIDLPSGSYTPTFSWPATSPLSSESAAEGHTPPHAHAAQPDAETSAIDAARGMSGAMRSRRWPRRLVGVAGLLGALAVLGTVAVTQQPSAAFDRFWAPLLRSKVPVLLCTGSIDVYELPPRIKQAANIAALSSSSPSPAQSPAQTPSQQAQARPQTFDARDVERVGAGFVSVADAVAIVRLAAIFQEHGTPYQVRENRATSFADLRTSPTVLVGMFSNAWTLELGSEFRFVPFIEEGTGRIMIKDRQHPERSEWQLQRPWPALTITRDYALVSRVFDPATGTMVVISAGITPFGTTAAAEFLTNRQLLDAALRHAPPDWPTRNLQLVLETRVIGGTAAPAHVLAIHVW